MYYWPDMTLDDEGTLYAVWNARFGPGPQMDNTGVFLSKSVDKGKTFTVTEISPAPVTYRYPMLQWTEHGGPEGTLHLVYEGATPLNIDWLYDVYHVRSTDGGKTWTAPTRLSDDPPQDLAGKYHPDLAIAPDGRVEVAWWDFRHDNGNFATDVYLVTSRDNGVTWSRNTRVTDRSISRPDRRVVWKLRHPAAAGDRGDQPVHPRRLGRHAQRRRDHSNPGHLQQHAPVRTDRVGSFVSVAVRSCGGCRSRRVRHRPPRSGNGAEGSPDRC